MKRLLSLFISVAALAFAASPALAAKPAKDTCTTIQSGTLVDSAGEVITTGFDEWGYNYQGHLFSGGFCDVYQDAAWCQEWAEDNLIMKWNDAWLSNKDCDGDKLLDRHYGHDSYIGSGAWLTNHQSGTYQGQIVSWNVAGTWLLDFAGGTDNRQFRNLVQDESGNVTGEFWWLNPATSQFEYGGTLGGNVTGNTLTLHYDRAPILYTGDFQATISETGLVDGSFADSHGNNLTWTATGVEPAVYETCTWNYFVKVVAVPANAINTDGVWYTPEGQEIGPDIWGEFAMIQEVSNDTCSGDQSQIYKSPVRAGLGNW
ncbi:MAG: hypothetical protein WC841_04955 [Candidatus Shapirobacteria bacterium]|jgi:hypothetical protein